MCLKENDIICCMSGIKRHDEATVECVASFFFTHYLERVQVFEAEVGAHVRPSIRVSYLRICGMECDKIWYCWYSEK